MGIIAESKKQKQKISSRQAMKNPPEG